MTTSVNEHRERPRPTSTDRSATRRRARTRAAVLRAASDCIREGGVDGATVAKITKRCGLSWGVIQYHFGDRAGLFLALLEEAFVIFDRACSRLESGSGSPVDRLESLVDGFWSLVSHDGYRVLLEIELQLSRNPGFAERIRPRAAEMRRRLRDVWRQALPGHPTPLVDRAERLVTASLRGLALERASVGPRRPHAADRATVKNAARMILGLEEP